MSHIKRNAALALGLSLLLAGCGGGGGSAPVVKTTTSAAAAVVIGARTAYVGRLIAGDGDNASGLVGIVAAAASGLSTGWQYSTQLQLYYDVTAVSTKEFSVAFSTGPNGTGSTAGTMDVTIVSGPPAPIVVHASYDITSQSTHLTGTLDFTAFDNAFTHVALSGNCNTTHPTTATTFSFDDNAGTITGSITSKAGGHTVSLTNLSYTPGTGLRGDIAVDSLTGSIGINPDGTGFVSFIDALGTFTIHWDASENVTLTGPTGSQSLGKLANL